MYALDVYNDKYSAANPEEQSAQQLVASGMTVEKYFVLWEADLSQADEPPDTILAWHKEVPEYGGYVCRLDGRVTLMTVDEYKAAKRAPMAERIDE